MGHDALLGAVGALKVSDEVEVELDAGLLPRAEEPAASYERINARELKPALLELEWISVPRLRRTTGSTRRTWKKRNEILGRLDAAGPDQLRELKVDLSFAVGAIKNHEVYFEHLGGEGGEPDGAFAVLIERDFGSAQAWRTGSEGDGDGRPRLGLDRVRLGRRPALQLRRRCAERLLRSGMRGR